MAVLVTAASRHGATLEIAETIARVLEESGIEVELIELDEVGDRRLRRIRGRKRDLPGQLARGGAPFYRRQCRSARAASDLAVRQRPIVGEPPVADDPDALRAAVVERLLETTNAREHKLFAGSLDVSKLGLLEKAAARGAHARATTATGARSIAGRKRSRCN